MVDIFEKGIKKAVFLNTRKAAPNSLVLAKLFY